MAYVAVAHIKGRLVDWAQLVIDLERAGWTQARIGDDIGEDQPWVNRLKNIPGTQPKFHAGMMIIGLWLEVTGQPADQLPRELAIGRNVKQCGNA